MSTYPLRKLIPDATMAFFCFLLPPGCQMTQYLVKKKISGKGSTRKKKVSRKKNFPEFLKVHFSIV